MKAVYTEHRVILTAVGVYSVNTEDEDVKALRERIGKLVLSHEYVKQIHGFYYNREERSVRFDVVVSFDAPSRQAVYAKIQESLKKEYPDIDFTLAMDMDYGEICEKN